MNRDAASDLGKRIINCWRGGPPLTEWVDELQRLDAGMAGTTFMRLRRDSEHAPSIARFLAEYRGIRGPETTTTPTSNEERISLEEYLSRLSGRAANGNTGASEELERWSRWLAPKEPSMRRRT